MKLSRKTGAVVALGLMLGATAAYASDPEPSERGCRQMAQQVSAAIRASGQSANLDAAKIESQDGADGCRLGYYRFGLSHYKKALALLTGN